MTPKGDRGIQKWNDESPLASRAQQKQLQNLDGGGTLKINGRRTLYRIESNSEELLKSYRMVYNVIKLEFK